MCNISAIFGNVVLCCLEVINIMDVLWDLRLGFCGHNVHQLPTSKIPKFQKLQHKMKNQGSKAIKVEHLLHFKVRFRFSFPLCNLLKASSCQHPLFESSLCSYDCVLESLHFAFIMMFS